jgi:HEAT repeat protein
MKSDDIDLLRDPDPRVRNRAALNAGTGRTCDDRTLMALREALDDSEWRVRGNAVRSLARVAPQNPDVFANILRLMEDNDECVRIAAFSAFCHMIENGYLCSNDDINVIASTYTDHRLDVRATAIRALSKLERSTIESVTAIAKALVDPSEDVQYWAIGAASALPQTPIQVLPALIKILNSGSDELRDSAVSVLNQIGRDARPAIPALRKLLQSSDAHLRVSAACALSAVDQESKDDAVTRVLREGLISGLDYERRQCAEALARLGFSNDKLYLSEKPGTK